MDRDPKTSGATVTRKGNSQAKSVAQASRKPAAKSQPSSQKSRSTRPTGKSRVTQSKSTKPAKNTKATKKHSKTPLIIAVIVAVLALLGAAFAAWYFCIHSNPDKVVLDAVNSVLTDDNLAIDGELQFLRTNTDNDSGLNWATFTFDSSSQTLPNTTNVHLKMSVDEDEILEFDLGAVQVRDGVIYLRVSGIMAALEDKVTDDVYEEMSDLFELLDLIDGEWWRISVSELTSYLGLGETGQYYQSLYDCTVQTLNNNHATELRQLYQDQKFLSIARNTSIIPNQDHVTVYDAKLDHEKLAAFLNGLFDTDAAKSYYACYNHTMQELYNEDYIELPWGGGFHPDPADAPTLSAEDFDEISATDVEHFLPNDLSVNLYIDNWTHRLRIVTIDFQLDDYAVAGMFSPRHQEAVIFEPEQYRPITDLLDEIMAWGEALFTGDTTE